MERLGDVFERMLEKKISPSRQRRAGRCSSLIGISNPQGTRQQRWWRVPLSGGSDEDRGHRGSLLDVTVTPIAGVVRLRALGVPSLLVLEHAVAALEHVGDLLDGDHRVIWPEGCP